MRKFLFCLVMLLSGAARADDLAAANALLEAKSYPQAMALLTRLAGNGNTAAQLRLGQVYWYGEGTSVDRARADALFAQAAAGGNEQARQAMALSGLREQHRKDISLWTTSYDGADMKGQAAACVPPAFPEKSTENSAIKKVQAEMAGWQECHNGFVKRLEGVLPVGKAIPVEVLDLMSDEEVEQAKTHLGGVYKQVAADAAVRAGQIKDAYGQWEKLTMAYVSEQNQLTAARERQIRDELEKMKLLTRPDAKCLGCQGSGGGGATRPPAGR